MLIYSFIWIILTFNTALLFYETTKNFLANLLGIIVAGVFSFLTFTFTAQGMRAYLTKTTRAAQLDNKIPYWDIWETQSTFLQEQYYTYYTYIWEHWHEMEERLLWISCTRAALIGL